jgi:uncharacterized membrane protein
MATIRESITDSIRYWEPRRIVYNLLLAITVAIYYVHGLPSSKTALTVDFVVLAVLANIAYFVDIFAQRSGFRESWRSKRWILVSVGMILAVIFTRFLSMGFFLSQSQ